MNRRRFLTIMAGTAALAALPRFVSASPELTQWRGVALGARTTITLEGGDAALLAEIRAEIARLEDIFSLYRPESELSRLNRDGRLESASPEMRACLSLAGRVHAASGGRFDPSIQPLWLAYAEAGGAPDDVSGLVLGWEKVGIEDERGGVTLRPGMALSLNGIAQGFIADRVADLLRARGMDRVMIDTGELRAIGPAPDGAPWQVGFDGGGMIGLRDRALASSSPRGMMIGTAGHILDPRSRRPSAAPWSLVSVSSPSAAVADALSTACCLMEGRAEMETAAAMFRDTRIELARG